MTLSPRTLALAARVGVPLDPTPHRRLDYDGNSIATAARDESTVIHDIAHWIVAPRSRRKLADFGLGSGPSSASFRTTRVVGWSKADSEEHDASLLGILIERSFGMDWVDTACDHSWLDGWSASDQHQPAELDHALEILMSRCGRLIKRGLVRADGSVPLAEEVTA